jgi:hypothetical protein
MVGRPCDGFDSRVDANNIAARGKELRRVCRLNPVALLRQPLGEITFRSSAIGLP